MRFRAGWVSVACWVAFAVGGCSGKTKESSSGNPNSTGNGNTNNANNVDVWSFVKKQVGDAEVGQYDLVVPGFQFFYVVTAGGNDLTASYPVAVAKNSGKLLRDADAVKAVLDSGYRDATNVARVALLFLERGGEVIANPTAAQHSSGVRRPAIDGTELVYFYRPTDAMSKDVYRSRVDLETMKVHSALLGAGVGAGEKSEGR